MAEIKNFKKAADTAKKAAAAVRNPKQALKFWKAFTNGKDSKINNGTAIAMVLVAFFADLVQLALALVAVGAVANPIITVVVWIGFFVWFQVLGVPFFGARKTASQVVNAAIKLIPEVDGIPTWTPNTILIIAFTRMEEASQPKEQSTPEEGEGASNVVKFQRRGEPAKASENPEIKSEARKAA